MIDRFALIIGAMKCGTTSLFTYLAQHPQVAPSVPKELDFFSRHEKWTKGFEAYQSLWDWDAQKHRVALEASTNYTKMPEFPNAAERISTFKADFRFIYMLRDPIERVQSQYAHEVIKGRARSSRKGVKAVHPSWINVSKYALQIAEYYKRFPSDRILLLDFADLKTQPDALMRRVVRFLDIDAEFAFTGLKTVHNRSARDHPLYLALTRNPLACAAAKLVPLRYKQGLRNRLARGLEFDAGLSDAQRAFIRSELADDMKKLSEEYGFDVSRWCQTHDGTDDV